MIVPSALLGTLAAVGAVGMSVIMRKRKAAQRALGRGIRLARMQAPKRMVSEACEGPAKTLRQSNGVLALGGIILPLSFYGGVAINARDVVAPVFASSYELGAGVTHEQFRDAWVVELSAVQLAMHATCASEKPGLFPLRPSQDGMRRSRVGGEFTVNEVKGLGRLDYRVLYGIICEHDALVWIEAVRRADSMTPRELELAELYQGNEEEWRERQARKLVAVAVADLSPAVQLGRLVVTLAGHGLCCASQLAGGPMGDDMRDHVKAIARLLPAEMQAVILERAIERVNARSK